METIFPSPLIINEDEITLVLHRGDVAINFAWQRVEHVLVVAGYNEETGEPQSIAGARMELSSEEYESFKTFILDLH